MSDLHDEFVKLAKKQEASSLHDEFVSLAKKNSAETPQEDVESIGSYAKSLGLGGLQGASMGFADEAEAGVRSLVQDQSYNQLLKDIRERYKKADEAHPYISGLGSVLGGAGSMLVGGAALKGLGLAGKAAAAAGAGEAALGAGEAAGLAEGAAAAVSSLETGAMAIAKPTMAKSIQIGAGTGALSGMGTSEASLKDEPGQLLKDTAYGAGVGGALGFGGDLLGKIAGGVADTGKTILTKSNFGRHMVEDFATGLEHGKTGEHVVGESRNKLKALKTVSDDLVNKIEAVEDKVRDNYKSFYTKADQAIKIDANELAIPIAEASSAIQQKGFVAPGAKNTVAEVFQQISNMVDDLAKRNNGKVTPSIVNDLMENIQSEYTKTAGDAALRHEANSYLQIKTSLKNWLDNKMGSELAGELSGIKEQTKTLSNLRSKLGIEKNLAAKQGTQAGQEASDELRDSLSSLFKKSVVNDEASIKLEDSMNIFKKLDPKMAADVSQKIEDASKVHNLATRLGEDSPLSKDMATMHQSGRSLSSMAAYQVGRGVGATAEGVGNVAQAPARFVKDIADVVMSDQPAQARQAATEMMQSPTESTRKFGNQLLQIINTENMSFRKALMYSLAGQPAFKEAVEGKPEK